MGVVDSQLPDLPQIPSASKMDEQTYLAMRVLRTDRKRANNFPELKGVIGDAKAYIKNDPQFQAYIGHIKDGQKSVLGWSALGLFQPVRGSQLEIVNAPTNTQQPEQPKQSGQHGTQPEQSQPEQQSDGRSEQSQESDQPGQSDEHNEEPEQSQQSGQRSTQPEQQSEQSDRQSGHSEQSQESDRPGQSDEHNEQPEQSGQRDTQPEQYTAHLAQSDVGSEPPPSEGAFGNVLSNLSRRTVAASNVTTASHLEEEFVVAKDEQIVNDSIILLLKCAIMNVPGIKCQWTSHRSPFPDMKLGTNKLAALTDGYLEGTDGKVYAIVEAKAATRHRVDRPKVLWQEAAEIVAWILNDPVGSYPNQLVKPTGGVQPNWYVRTRMMSVVDETMSVVESWTNTDEFL